MPEGAISEIATRFSYPPVVTSQLLKRKIILPTLCPRHTSTIITTSSGRLGECCGSYLLRSSRTLATSLAPVRPEAEAGIKLLRNEVGHSVLRIRCLQKGEYHWFRTWSNFGNRMSVILGRENLDTNAGSRTTSAVPLISNGRSRSDLSNCKIR